MVRRISLFMVAVVGVVVLLAAPASARSLSKSDKHKITNTCAVDSGRFLANGIAHYFDEHSTAWNQDAILLRQLDPYAVNASINYSIDSDLKHQSIDEALARTIADDTVNGTLASYCIDEFRVGHHSTKDATRMLRNIKDGYLPIQVRDDGVNLQLMAGTPIAPCAPDAGPRC